MCWDSLAQKVQCNSLAVGHRKRSDKIAFHKMCNVTHLLLVIRINVMRLASAECHSQTVGHRKRLCDEVTSFHKICNAIHLLLAIGNDEMRLSYTECAMSLTNCWS